MSINVLYNHSVNFMIMNILSKNKETCVLKYIADRVYAISFNRVMYTLKKHPFIYEYAKHVFVHVGQKKIHF